MRRFDLQKSELLGCNLFWQMFQDPMSSADMYQDYFGVSLDPVLKVGPGDLSWPAEFSPSRPERGPTSH